MAGKSVHIGVLALQGGVREHLQALEQCGTRATAIKTIEQFNSVDALVIPGGESTTIIKLATRYEFIEPIREKISRGFPVYGSCAGMILLADEILDGTADQETFGGLDVVVQRNAFGRQTESFEAPVKLPGDPDAFPGVFIRAPMVISHGSGVEVISSIEAGPHAGRIVGIAQDNLMATAYHPELTSDTRVHKMFVDRVKAG